MNKFASIAWLLLLSPTIELQENHLVMTCSEAFEGVLYLDDHVFLEIEEDDFVDNQLCIETTTGGIYTLFNADGKMVERVVLKDDKSHIAFDTIIQSRIDNKYLFQTSPKTLIVSEIEDERYEGEFKDDYYYYEFEGETIEFLEDTYELYVDDTPPTVSLDAYYLESEDLYFTNTNELRLYYEDECPEPFILYPEKEIQVTLQEGINDLSSYLKDQANLSSQDKLWVIYDKEAPHLDVENLMYISSPKTFEIEEPYLNLKKSKLVLNGIDKPLETNSFEITETSKVELVLEDYAGNSQEYSFDVIYDDVKPIVYSQLSKNQLHLSYSEPLSHHRVIIKETGESIYHDYTFNSEGIYVLEGEVIDYAGNKTEVYETLHIDLYEPKLTLPKATSTYLEVPTIEVSGSDTFDLEWQIEVLRNNEAYTFFEGIGNFKQEICLDEQAFKEASGVYEIKVNVSDGTYKQSLSESYIVDLYCAPLEVKIDGYEASQVKELLVNRLIEFDITCKEGSPKYRLYKDDILMKEGEEPTLLLSPEDSYTHLEVIVQDEFGHENIQRINLAYPTLPTNFFEEEPHETIEEVEVEEEVKIQKEEPKIEEMVVEEAKSNTLGGWIIGAIIVSVLVFGKIRFRKNRHDSTCEKTVLFENQEDTVLLDHSETRE